MKTSKEWVKQTKGIIIPFKNGVLVKNLDSSTYSSTSTSLKESEYSNIQPKDTDQDWNSGDPSTKLDNFLINSPLKTETVNKELFDTKSLSLQAKRFKFEPHSKYKYLTHKMEVYYDSTFIFTLDY